MQRKTFCLRRHSSDIIPVVYIPLSSPPTPNVEPSRPVEKGSPSLPPKDGQGFVETFV